MGVAANGDRQLTMVNTERARVGALTRSVARALAALAVGLLLLGTGCSVERRVEPAVLPAPLTAKIPLRIGVHYTPEFRLARPVTGTTVWKIGTPSVALFNSVLRDLFDDVIEVDRWPPTADRPTVAGVVIPIVLAAGWQRGRSEVRYQVELFSPAGDRAASWEVAGHSVGDPSILGSKEEEQTRDAMRAAGADLIVSFFREPQVRAWLEANGVSPDALMLK